MNHIQSLIDHYLQGTTTCHEEQELKDYFASGDISPEYKKYAPLFTWHNSVATDADTLDDIFARSVAQLNQSVIITSTQLSPKKQRHTALWGSVAATIVIVFSATLFLTNRPSADNTPFIAQQRPTPAHPTPQTQQTALPTLMAGHTSPNEKKASLHQKKSSVTPIQQTNATTNSDTEAEQLDTFSDPDIAYAEAQRALQLLSDKLNKGLEMIENTNNSNS